MKILSVQAASLHGHIDFNHKLNSDLNIIVGINGSGKTSALHVIDWLTGPDISALSDARFDTLSITASHNGEDFSITASSEHGSGKILTVKFVNSNKVDLVVPISDAWRHREMDRYNHYKDVPRSMRSRNLSSYEATGFSFIKSLPAPTLISLERSIRAETESGEFLDSPRSARDPQNSPKSPLDHLQNLFQREYSKYRAEVAEYDSNLKDKILAAAISSPSKAPAKEVEPMGRYEVDRLQRNIKQMLSSNTYKKIASDIDLFFEEFHELIQYYKSIQTLIEDHKNPIFNLMRQQIHRINQLYGAFKSYESQKERAFLKIDRMISATNEFLTDTDKEIFVNHRLGKLSFRSRGMMHEGHTSQEERDLKYLSSGEKQVLILFGLLSFRSNPQSVFIVDEPELSLHPVWQLNFMEAFLRLCPSETQLIVATHSPEIVGKNKLKCVVF